ncbi:hypothetical protein HZA26_00800 [Candidatus Nomurabacteria bacterium]|nr:hypothetical protein [Candidatus Nomurabacteria bacterium]
MLNLDTHILIFALSDQLHVSERKLLSENPWSVSGIVFWELEKLSQLKKIELDLEDREVQSLLSKIHVWPIDLNVCRYLRALDFKSDPVDEIISATSIAYRVPLLTRDRKIKKSKVVPLA